MSNSTKAAKADAVDPSTYTHVVRRAMTVNGRDYAVGDLIDAAESVNRQEMERQGWLEPLPPNPAAAIRATFARLKARRTQLDEQQANATARLPEVQAAAATARADLEEINRHVARRADVEARLRALGQEEASLRSQLADGQASARALLDGDEDRARRHAAALGVSL
jgi:chromosome segregation ATPase